LHSGLTGRKTAIDTYGEYARHSGAALSGKDPLRVDRIAAYAARYAAKNLVAAGLAHECEVHVSYGIGQTLPVSIQVNTYGSGTVPEDELARRLADVMDWSPGGIARGFDLQRQPALRPEGFYRHLARYGQMGREDLEAPWEARDLAERLR
jgi:S-adenosylmethionine synthetase